MSIVWCGGEDIDFQNGVLPVADTTSGHFRTSYSRCTVGYSPDGIHKSTTFTAVTSCWLSAQIYVNWAWSNEYTFGLGKSGTNSGIFIGQGGSGHLAIHKLDAGTITQLIEHASLNVSLALHRFDIQVVSYGSSGTVNVYMDGTLQLTYTGSIAASGVTNLDQVWINTNSSRWWNAVSEVIVADEDTRPFDGLLTMAPTGAGTTTNWTNNTYTNVNETTLDDTSAAYSNTNSQDQQYNITDLPSGTWTIKAVQVTTRAWATSDATPQKIKLGFNSGGTVGVGSAQTLGAGAAAVQQLFATNPVTGSAWSAASMNALQVDLQAST